MNKIKNNTAVSEEMNILINTGNVEMLKVAYQDPKLRNIIEEILKGTKSNYKAKLDKEISKAKAMLVSNTNAQLTSLTCSIEAFRCILKHFRGKEFENFSTYDFFKIAYARNPVFILQKDWLFCALIRHLLKNKEPEAIKLFNKNMLFTGFAAHGISYETNNLHLHYSNIKKCTQG